MNGVTQKLSDAIKKEAKRQGLTHADLARAAKRSERHVGKMLKGQTGGVTDPWQGMLEALGLKLYIEHEDVTVKAMTEKVLE